MASELEKLLAQGSMAATGGYAQAALGGLQTIYGLTQLPKARAEFERAKAAAPSLETPSQFYENYKNAYDATLAGMQSDAIQANLATSVQALQGAGGRAVVGGLTAATAQALSAQNQMLAQERQMRLAAGQQLAAAEERSIGRKEARSQQEMAYANQAYQAALGNIGAGLGAVGEGLMYGMSAKKKDEEGKGILGVVKDKASNIKEGVSEKISDIKEGVSEKISDIKTNRAVKRYGDFVTQSRQMIADSEKPSFLKTPELNMPSLTDTFMQNKPLGFGEKPVTSIAPKTVDLNLSVPEPKLQPINMPTPVPTRYEPMGSPIPLEYRNDQAIKQLEALQKGYNMVAEYNKYFFNGGMMTSGAFNHATNPIDLIQNGQKVGEATGGEIILNPSQAKAIAKQSSYARKLFKMFEKNAKKNK